ncbi:MAG: glycosyltransferase family 2 protein [Bacillota bacterium]
MYKVSVIIPIYNVRNYLERTLQVVIDQKLKDIEIILINDGSTDGSEMICDQYAKNDTRVKVIHQKNCGVSYSRNRALDMANGKYVFFMDADDYIEEEMLLNLYELGEKNNSDLVICGFYFESNYLSRDKQLRIDKYCVNFPDSIYPSKEEFKKDFVQLWDKHLLYNVWNKLYRLDLIRQKSITFPKFNFGEDFEFNKSYLKECEKICITSNCYYHYIREREGSSTTKHIADLFNIRIREHENLIKYFEEFGVVSPDAEEFLARRYIERAIGCIENLFNNNPEMALIEKYAEVKRIITHKHTRNSLSTARPTSKKMKIMLVPVKIKSTLFSMFMGWVISNIRSLSPSFFTKLKQCR